MEPRGYLDTHCIIWLYEDDQERFSPLAKDLIDRYDLFFSPMVRLELKYLFELKRIHFSPATILSDLKLEIDLTECNHTFEQVIQSALGLSWTRDPFDRIIVAQAAIGGNILLTKDRVILDNYKHAVW